MNISTQPAVFALAAGLALAPMGAAKAAECSALAGKTIGGAAIVSAERIEAGAKLSLPGPAAGLQIAPLSTAICRVEARIHPETGSEIKAVVWLPERWNGKFVGTGGGGFAGGYDNAPAVLNPIVAKGYAAAATDVGHSDVLWSARFSYQAPARIVDWGHRGNHLTAVFGKALVAAYYGAPARQSYFTGCSNGGRDGLMEAWRYPDDYDGVVAVAPVAPAVRILSGFAWTMQQLDGPPPAMLTAAKLKLLGDALMARCDTLDGVKDGVIENPRKCRFDPAELQCRDNETTQCLSAADVRAARAIYQGPRTNRGEQIEPGFEPGSEGVDWGTWILGQNAAQRLLGVDGFRWMIHQDPDWSLDQFDLEKDYRLGEERLGAIVNSDNPDIRPFLKRGGKLILAHGWADGAIPPMGTIHYYEAVERKTHDRGRQVRLFMAPGMGHCNGGSGPSQFDMLAALEKWRATGTAPERVIAAKPEDAGAAYRGLPSRTLQTRPLCAWPKHATYIGRGSTDDAANFRCTAEPRSPKPPRA